MEIGPQHWQIFSKNRYSSYSSGENRKEELAICRSENRGEKMFQGKKGGGPQCGGVFRTCFCKRESHKEGGKEGIRQNVENMETKERKGWPGQFAALTRRLVHIHLQQKETAEVHQQKTGKKRNGNVGENRVRWRGGEEQKTIP